MKTSKTQRTDDIKVRSHSVHKNSFIPPTCSTFNNFGTIRSKLCNVAGYKNEKYFSNAHKKTFATFGLPKDKLINDNHRDMCMT